FYQLYHAVDGNLIQVPGLPLMYDYEFFPQTVRLSLYVHFIREADGIITSGTTAFEAEALTAWKSWQTSLGKELYILGPLLPIGDENTDSGTLAKENEMTLSDKGSEIEEFLEKALREHGKHSLIYISFGSAHWPDTIQLSGFIDVLIEQRIPFILAYASRMAKIPDRITEKVQETGLGLLSTWAPQQLILCHKAFKATGWFVSHCGQNSVTESLAEGVPIIGWPITADQPYNAALISITLNIGYQLTEARTGDAGLRALKSGVQPAGTVEALLREIRYILEKARGEDGKLKRQNAHTIKIKMKAAWDDQGEAAVELRKLLSKVFSSP
ncbi:glycosyltransferase family 1 protein, partial [Sphaerobolus stellatus SS14]